MTDPAGASEDAVPLLQIRGMHKRFGGVHALRGVDLDVRAGEVHALVGENGAGKSTIINVLAGAVRRDQGEITFGGRAVAFPDPAASQHAGISIIHQELTTLPALTVAENIFMGRMPARLGIVDRAAMRRRSVELLDRVGLAVDPDTRVGELALSQQQLVEIAKALSLGARLLVMDEPTASLTEHETRRLLDLVRGLRAHGVTVVYVSHRLGEVFAIADRITVLRDGRSVGTVVARESSPTAVVGLMVGRQLAARTTRATAPGAPVLELRGVTRGAAARDVSFTVRAGEVVGMAGLIGAGRTEVARLVFGADRPDAGTILLDGRELRLRSPADALVAGIAMVPEDRKQLALFMDKSVRWNVSMARLPWITRRGLIDGGREATLARSFVEQLRIRTPDDLATVARLSGGNQQKTVLARWLATRPRVLLLDEPTHGVDVGAKAEIHELVRELAAGGMAILLISSELTEVLDLSDRIVVMRGGRVAAVLDRRDADEHSVMLLATGTAPVPAGDA